MAIPGSNESEGGFNWKKTCFVLPRDCVGDLTPIGGMCDKLLTYRTFY